MKEQYPLIKIIMGMVINYASAWKFEHYAFECHPWKHGSILEIMIESFYYTKFNNSNNRF